MNRIQKSLLIFLVVFILLFSFIPVVSNAGIFKTTVDKKAPAVGTSGAFAFVSDFLNGGNYEDYGWQMIGKGSAIITNTVNYFGEPSIMLSKNTVLVSNKNVIQGDNSFSFQALVNGSYGFISIINSENQPLFSIGVNGKNIYFGNTPQSAKLIGNAPNSVYPGNWVYLTAYIYNSSTNKQFSWTMQLFVDETDKVFANISVPDAYEYAGIMISPLNGSSYFTDIIFTSYQIPIYNPGYNLMMGYGQGSGLIVKLLPPFTVIHENMILHSWSVPEMGILSFQINVMNYYGTTRSTGVGFFQLGVDIDPNGTISPWYVPGKNMVAHYFLNSSNPAVQPGFPTPNNSLLSLNIIYDVQNKTILFQIIDFSASSQYRYWNATIPYNGSEFYSTYTQLEFQPSSSYPVQDYYFNGAMFNISYGDSLDSLTPLNSTYMLPFTLDAPATWCFTYYNSNISGYSQISS